MLQRATSWRIVASETEYRSPPHLVIPAVGTLLALCGIVFLRDTSGYALSIVTLLVFGMGTWLTVSTQLRFNNGLATFAVAMGAVLMILLATGTISLSETADFVKGLRDKG